MSSAAAPAFFSGLCDARRGRRNLALYQPIDGEFSRSESENQNDGKQEEKFVSRQKLIRITENDFHCVEVGGEVRDGQQNRQRNGNQAGAKAEQ